MKTIKYLAMVVLTIVLASCSKDGSIGPVGDKGDAGAPGNAGTDGKTILNGTSDPKEEEGKSGDFFLNTNSYVLFGPKTAPGWGSGTSILGEKGDQGVKGDNGEADHVILSGPTDPSDKTGKLNDFYYNSRTKTLFYRTGTLKSNRWMQVAKLANTIQFTKTLYMRAGTSHYPIIFDLPYEVFKRSMINVYLGTYESKYWTPIPGLLPGGDGSADYIHFERGPELEEDNMLLDMVFNNVPEGLSEGELRIVVTEADVFKVISKKVDFKNYKEVNRYSQLGQ